MQTDSFYVYTDASFSKDHNLGVIGYLIYNNEKEHTEILPSDKDGKGELVLLEISEGDNIRSEIKGALAALSNCPSGSRVVLFTDCQTIVDLPARRDNLESTDFISKASGKELTNAQLYRDFYRAYDLLKLEVKWIRGHGPGRSLGSSPVQIDSENLDPVQSNFAYLDKKVRKFLRSKTKN